MSDDIMSGPVWFAAGYWAALAMIVAGYALRDRRKS